MIALLLALAPAAAIIHYFYWRDKYEKEPLKLLIYAFLLGIFSIVPAVSGGILGSYFGIEISQNVLITFIHAFIAVALFEELAKYIFLRYFMFKREEFDEPYDGIMYAVMIGMGFAAFENILYVMQGGLSLAIARMFTAVPAHGAFGAVMGYYVGLAKFDTKNRTSLLLKGLLGAVILHGAYDFFLMQQGSEGLMIMALPILAVSIYYAKKAVNTHQKNSPFNPKNRTNPPELAPQTDNQTAAFPTNFESTASVLPMQERHLGENIVAPQNQARNYINNSDKDDPL